MLDLQAADFELTELDLLEDFLAEEAQEEELADAFLLQEQLPHCSIAIVQKYSSWPCGQPAFCQL